MAKWSDNTYFPPKSPASGDSVMLLSAGTTNNKALVSTFLIASQRNAAGGVAGIESNGFLSLTTDLINQGTTNLYFTQALARATTLTGLSITNSAITAADTILSAMGKLQGQIGAAVTGVSSVFGRTGAVVAANGDYTTSQITGLGNRNAANGFLGVASDSSVVMPGILHTNLFKINLRASNDATAAGIVHDFATFGDVTTIYDYSGVKLGSTELGGGVTVSLFATSAGVIVTGTLAASGALTAASAVIGGSSVLRVVDKNAANGVVGLDSSSNATIAGTLAVTGVTTASSGLVIQGAVPAATTITGTNGSKKILFYDTNGNNFQFCGFGLVSGLQIYQVNASTADHVFYCGLSSTTQRELFRIKGTGYIIQTLQTSAFGSLTNGQMGWAAPSDLPTMRYKTTAGVTVDYPMPGGRNVANGFMGLDASVNASITGSVTASKFLAADGTFTIEKDPFGGVANGPCLYGPDGGSLAATGAGNKIAMRWDTAQKCWFIGDINAAQGGALATFRGLTALGDLNVSGNSGLSGTLGVGGILAVTGFSTLSGGMLAGLATSVPTLTTNNTYQLWNNSGVLTARFRDNAGTSTNVIVGGTGSGTITTGSSAFGQTLPGPGTIMTGAEAWIIGTTLGNQYAMKGGSDGSVTCASSLLAVGNIFGANFFAENAGSSAYFSLKASAASTDLKRWTVDALNNGTYTVKAWEDTFTVSNAAISITRTAGTAGAAPVIGITTLYGTQFILLNATRAERPTGTAWDNPSDPKLKRDIIDADNEAALARIMRVPFKDFMFKPEHEKKNNLPSDKRYISPLADDVMEEIYPGSVNKDGEYNTINQSPLIADYGPAIQNLVARVQALEARH